MQSKEYDQMHDIRRIAEDFLREAYNTNTEESKPTEPARVASLMRQNGGSSAYTLADIKVMGGRVEFDVQLGGIGTVAKEKEMLRDMVRIATPSIP